MNFIESIKFLLSSEPEYDLTKPYRLYVWDMYPTYRYITDHNESVLYYNDSHKNDIDEWKAHNGRLLETLLIPKERLIYTRSVSEEEIVENFI